MALATIVMASAQVGCIQTDALSAILFVVAALFVLHKISAARAQSLAADNSRVG